VPAAYEQVVHSIRSTCRESPRYPFDDRAWLVANLICSTRCSLPPSVPLPTLSGSCPRIDLDPQNHFLFPPLCLAAVSQWPEHGKDLNARFVNMELLGSRDLSTPCLGCYELCLLPEDSSQTMADCAQACEGTILQRELALIVPSICLLSAVVCRHQVSSSTEQTTNVGFIISYFVRIRIYAHILKNLCGQV
jgi:hypothetical protein